MNRNYSVYRPVVLSKGITAAKAGKEGLCGGAAATLAAVLTPHVLQLLGAGEEHSVPILSVLTLVIAGLIKAARQLVKHGTNLRPEVKKVL